MRLPKFKYVFEQEWLVERCINKSVLHLGCAGDVTLQGGRNASLHAKIYDVSEYSCGIEINENSLNILKGFLPEDNKNIYYLGDVEKLGEIKIGKKFDIILVGSIIEHLSNVGLMIEGANTLLKDNGLFLVSTPHTWGLLQYLRVLYKRIESVHPEHTCWYSVSTLMQIFSRYNLVPNEWATGYGWQPDSIKWTIKKFFGIPFFKIFPHIGGSLLGSFRKQL